VGYSSGAHANPFIFNTGGSFSSFTSEFDTIIIPSTTGDYSAVGVCPANSAIAGAGSSGNIYLSPNSGSTLSGVIVSNDTLIASPVRGGLLGFDTKIARADGAKLLLVVSYALPILFLSIFSAFPSLVYATTCDFGSSIGGGQCQGFLTSGTSWTVPADWSNTNTIELIGGGAGGQDANSSSGGGGGGGAYAKISNLFLTTGNGIAYVVGTGGSDGDLATAGNDTYFNGASCAAASVCGKGGSAPTGFHGVTGGIGGATSTSIGTTLYAGGNGGSTTAFNNASAGGGGAGGPNGNGGGGHNQSGSRSNAGGTGGGGNGGGSPGSDSSGSTGGNGGNNSASSGQGTGGGPNTNGTNGTAGGGGGAGGAGGLGVSGNGGLGGAGTEWDASHGSGGGGGSGGTASTGTAGTGGTGACVPGMALMLEVEVLCGPW
jgi:hypothetical protein